MVEVLETELARRPLRCDELDEGKMTPIMWACVNGKIDCVRVLIAKKCSLNERDQSGRTALICAATMGHRDIVALLCRRHARINEVDNYGRTALMKAFEFAHMDTAHELINASADYTIQDKNGFTCVHPLNAENRALFESWVSVPHLRRSASSQNNMSLNNISPSSPSSSSSSSSSSSPPHSPGRLSASPSSEFPMNMNTEEVDVDIKALIKEKTTHASSLLDKILTQRPIRANEHCDEGKTPLMEACIHSNIPAIEVILNAGGQMELRDVHGRTALLLAAEKGHIDTINTLINAGANVNAADKKGNSAMHIAALNGHDEAVTTLLKGGQL